MATDSPRDSERSSLNERVAAEIRAEMGRQGMVNKQLAQKLGVSEAWTTRHLSAKSADTQPLTLTDVENIAVILNVSPLDLLPHNPHSGGVQRQLSAVDHRPNPSRPRPRPKPKESSAA
jgi:hypothetical protein